MAKTDSQPKNDGCSKILTKKEIGTQMDYHHNHQTEQDRTQGISSELAVAAVGNRYDLILIASRRTRELSRGDTALVACRRGPIVTALAEIEQGQIGRGYLHKPADITPARRKRTA